jgi:Na+/H+-dicarboxylate symporter
MDSFGTAGNVTGDGAIALIMDRIAARLHGSVPDVPDGVTNEVEMDQNYARH